MLNLAEEFLKFYYKEYEQITYPGKKATDRAKKETGKQVTNEDYNLLMDLLYQVDDQLNIGSDIHIITKYAYPFLEITRKEIALETTPDIDDNPVCPEIVMLVPILYNPETSELAVTKWFFSLPYKEQLLILTRCF